MMKAVNLSLLLFIFLKFGYYTTMDPEKYLYHYGYLNSTGANDDEMKSAIKEFQEHFNLPMTGNLDAKTMNIMLMPRCGMPDKAYSTKDEYKERSVWSKNHLTYKIRNTSSPLTKYQMKKAFKNAINLWLDNINLVITESRSDKADIDVYFTSEKSDEPAIAYAYFPENGDIYFNSSEEWSLDTDSSKEYFISIAAHELGHALGLDHDMSSKSSIMYPYYQESQKTPLETDKKNLRDLYGEKNLDNTGLCKDSTVDAMLYTNCQGHILIKGPNYWTFTESSLQQGPLPLQSLFPEMPDQIDAAFSTKKAVYYFFKDNVFYRYNGTHSNYRKKLISKGFHDDVPSNINAVIYDETNKIIYFFKGTKYYAFGTRSKKVTVGQISEWGGISGKVEAAVVLNNDKVLFIRRKKDERTMSLSDIKFPKLADVSLFVKKKSVKAAN